MASAYHCAFLLLLLIARICDATAYDVHDLAMAREHERWMAKYGRVYKDETEKARRFEIFKENVNHIEEFNNAGEHKYKLGLGPFTDLTNEEFVASYASGSIAPEMEFESRRSIKYETEESLDVTLVSSFDWRTKGAVTPVKFQDGCGSCWSFAAAATVESLTFIKKGLLFNLSAQQLIDCDKNNMGCSGGWTGKAYDYIIRRPGITTEENYPFTGKKGQCKTKKEFEAVADISDYVYVPRDDEKSLMNAVKKQPVAVLIDATNLHHYISGVFNGPCTTKVNHAVVAVGYGEEEDATKYWIIKNSWGDWWGEAGYFRVQKDVVDPQGTCGLAKWANYPTA